jgi:serine/threonine-protein kinase ATR
VRPHQSHDVAGTTDNMHLRSPTNHFEKDILSSWLMTAKMARKAGHWQTAYSATLQARQNGDLSTQIQSAKLVKAMGEPHRALQELEGSLRLFGVVGTDVIDMAEEEEDKKVKAKVRTY